MAKTRLTEEQQVIVRYFIDEVLSDEKVMSGEEGRRRTVANFCYNILGYQVLPNGAAIPLGKEVKTSYGGGFTGDPFKDYPDEYAADGRNLKGYKVRRKPRSRK